MKQENIEIKLNKIKKQKLNPISSLKIFFKLYFKNIRIFKFDILFRPVTVAYLVLFLAFSVSAYSYNSKSVLYGNNLYSVKTGIENVLLKTKITNEQKIKYLTHLIDRRLEELEYLNNNNFLENKKFSINLVNIAYAESINNKSAASNILLEIIKLNEKIELEFEKIKDIKQKEKLNLVINKTIEKENVLINKIKTNKNISDEVRNSINALENKNKSKQENKKAKLNIEQNEDTKLKDNSDNKKEKEDKVKNTKPNKTKK